MTTLPQLVKATPQGGTVLFININFHAGKLPSLDT